MRPSRFSTLLAALLAACGSGRPAPPTVVDRVGELELLALEQVEAAGDSGRTTRYSRWSLRWRGETVEVSTAAGLFGDRREPVHEFHAVFVLDGPAPALIVLAGDPNNTGAFHRLSAQAGQLESELLCIVGAGANSVTVPGTGKVDAVRFSGPRLERLEAERLLLGDHCLYAPATRTLRVLPHVPDGLTVPTAWGPIVRQPDGDTLARLLLDDAGDPLLGWVTPLALPEGLVAGSVDAQRWLAEAGSTAWRTWPIERTRMRYASPETIDAAWIDHHFRWGPSDRGLTVREDAPRLPYRGVLSPGLPEYRLHGLKAGQRERLVAVLVERLGGVRVTGRDETYSIEVKVGAQTLQVHDIGFYISQATQYWPGTPEDPAVQRAAMADIARDFDAVLATGALDGIFYGEPAP